MNIGYIEQKERKKNLIVFSVKDRLNVLLMTSEDRVWYQCVTIILKHIWAQYEWNWLTCEVASFPLPERDESQAGVGLDQMTSEISFDSYSITWATTYDHNMFLMVLAHDVQIDAVNRNAFSLLIFRHPRNT